MYCELCGSPFLEQHCPLCTDAQREAFRGIQPGVFPMTAMPPEGALSPQVAGSLRRTLMNEDLSGAERLWTQVLSTMRPLGPQGRAQLAASLEACAALKDAVGKDGEAQRLRQRAATARKDPQELHRKQGAAAAGAGLGWDNHAWVRLQADTESPDRQAAIAAVRAEMDQQEARSERTKRACQVGALSIFGLAGGSALGLPVLATGAVGAGLGWYLSRVGKL